MSSPYTAGVNTSQNDPHALMELAMQQARLSIAGGGSPFGCVIAQDGQVIAQAHNTVLQTTDITAHAEINALRQACRAIGQVHLAGATVISTCEPCPMCMAALHWAQVERVYYGAGIADAAQAGFNELTLSAGQLLELGHSRVQLISGLRSVECAALFREWQSAGRAVPY